MHFHLLAFYSQAPEASPSSRDFHLFKLNHFSKSTFLKEMSTQNEKLKLQKPVKVYSGYKYEIASLVYYLT